MLWEMLEDLKKQSWFGMTPEKERKTSLPREISHLLQSEREESKAFAGNVDFKKTNP